MNNLCAVPQQNMHIPCHYDTWTTFFNFIYGFSQNWSSNV